jgi:hypothetical protein
MEHLSMSRPLLLALLLTASLLVVPKVSAQAPAAKEESARLARLIARLGSEDFREREEAARDLDKIGPRALDALRKAAESNDAEVCRRAGHLVSVIQRREETARVLEPKRVQLLFKDTPLPDALDDFARRTGYTLVLEGREKLAGRKVTLDTGSVPFWEAFEQFCRKAGLVEPSLLPSDGKPATEAQPQQDLFMGRRGIYYPTPRPTQDTSRLAVVDGKAPALPTVLAGALRIRALPPGTPVSGQYRGEGDKLIPLDVTPEPGIGWHGVLGLRITRAIDEQGRKLQQPAPYVGAALDEFDDYGAVAIWGGMPYDAVPVNDGHSRAIPACLHVGGQPGKLIKEMHGVVTVQVQTPLEPLLSVDNVLGATGKTVHGPYGGALKVIDVQREKNGQINLHVHLETPQQDGDGAWDVMPGARGRRINRAIIMWRMNQTFQEMPDLRLLDAKGQPWKKVEAPRQPNGVLPGVISAQEFEPKFQPGAGQAEPARLVFMGRRTLILDVPFTLRDVPLR